MNDQFPENLQAELAKYKISLKGDSKNNLVRRVLYITMEQAKLNAILKRLHEDIEKLKEEAKVSDGFIKENEVAFQSYVDSIPNGPPQDIAPETVGRIEKKVKGAI